MIHKHSIGYALTFLISVMLFFSCDSGRLAKLTESAIIPIPVAVSDGEGTFTIQSGTKISFSPELSNEAQFLNQLLKTLTSLDIGLDESAQENVIELLLSPNVSMPEEGYQLEVGNEKITITAKSASGIFWGIQTLAQILPTVDGRDFGPNPQFKLAAGSIEDYPEYGYRGMMLDVARHFFPVSEVKHLIDQISQYKINHLHLHLSDDQGWRIEIKSWPLLTEIGGSTQVGGESGGFYTQEDYQEIVRYAQERHMTIVPEIDMPGHTNAALAAYGDLNPGIKVPEEGAIVSEKTKMGVAGQPTPLYTGTEVGFSTLDTDKPVTYQFVEDVIREISEITPGPYFHIGGDESHVTEMEDYIPFIEKAQDLVTKYGKKTLGWDEVAHAKLLPTSVAQYWAKSENAVMAIEQGAKVLISPATKVYLDMKYDSTTHIGLSWAAYIELDEAYNWDPTTLDDNIKREHIVGVEAPLWTETVTNREEIEYLTFPRLAAIAEVAWSPKEKRDWESFVKRIKTHGKRWESEGIKFYKSPKVNW